MTNSAGDDHGARRQNRPTRQEGREKAAGKEGRKEKSREAIGEEVRTQGRQEKVRQEGDEEALTLVDRQDQRILDEVGRIRARRDAIGDSISTQVRAIALGVIATAWLLISPTATESFNRFKNYSESLLWVAAAAVVALVVDMLQMSGSYRVTHVGLRHSLNATRLSDVGYPTKRWKISLLYVLFVVKQALITVSALWLVCTVAFVLAQT
jgi:hypothetical protein